MSYEKFEDTKIIEMSNKGEMTNKDIHNATRKRLSNTNPTGN